MDESLKVIDYIRNAAEYVKTKGWKHQRQPDVRAFPVPIQYAVYNH